MKEVSNGKERPFKKEVSALFDLMKSENLEELELKDKDFHVHIKRKGKRTAKPQYIEVPVEQPQSTVEVPAPAAAAASAACGVSGETIKSPITGVFYRASSPSSPPFSKEGEMADAGKTLCIIEAMKVMNEIKAERRVKIVKILIENGKSVVTGQDLFVIE